MKKIVTTLLWVTCALLCEANSPYISKVFDFLPAPGQFVNQLPEYEVGDSKSEIIEKVEEQICGDKNPGMISLGSYGGYVVFGFDHPVVNLRGEYDFKIYGNAFKANNASSGGSSEPGIVMVSCDSNENGVPDDDWYELAGSEYYKSETIHGYKITYYKPDADRDVNADPDPEYKYIIDRTYVGWDDNIGESGYVMRNAYHKQSYWPEWIGEDEILFEGTRLKANGYDQSGNGSYFVQNFYDWGYADNQPNDTDLGFKIDWAVDEDGNPVELDCIDFIKVYCAVNQYCGWIGECSTEICGAEDLHPDAAMSALPDVEIDSQSNVEYYNLQGLRVLDPTDGIYIVKQGNQIFKIKK
ncbi:MAG: hypothetical protein IJZ17_04090 [Muribaculaceae bacterium]|nr:hypothetical protein [Muribaculaceae bacterium]